MYVISYCQKNLLFIYIYKLNDHIKCQGSSFKQSLGYNLRSKFVVSLSVISTAE